MEIIILHLTKNYFIIIYIIKIMLLLVIIRWELRTIHFHTRLWCIHIIYGIV